MKIGIDFDDTIVETKEKVREYLDKFGIGQFENIFEKEQFYIKYIDDMTLELKLKENVIDILKKLSRKNELYIITARNEFYSKNCPKMVLKYIKKYKLPIKNIYFDCFKDGKAKKCKELGIDLFIDDHIENCLEVEKLGIKALLFQNQYNGLTTINSWDEIFNYIEVNYGRKSDN